MARAKRMLNEGKMFSKWKILCIIAIIIAVFFVIATKVINKPENDTKDIKQEKYFENLIVKNIDVNYENGNSLFKMELANESDTDFESKNIKIIFKNEDGTEYAIIKYNLTDIRSGDSFYINTSTNIDLTKASDFCIESQ